jgi:hypothetical protein
MGRHMMFSGIHQGVSAFDHTGTRSERMED